MSGNGKDEIMKKLLLATVIALVPLTAHASGWQSDFDCGEGVVAIGSGWHGRMFLDIEDNGKTSALVRNDVFSRSSDAVGFTLCFSQLMESAARQSLN
jgi:hypothetical protein